MVEHVYEFPDFKLKYSRDLTFPFTDHTGKTAIMSSYGFYDPQTLEDFGLDTVKKVCVWWIKNRDRLTREGRYMSDYYEYFFDGYTDRNEDFYRDTFWGENTHYPIDFSYRSVSLAQSDLFESDPSPSKPIKKYSRITWRRRATVQDVHEDNPVAPLSGISSTWTNHHNYTFKMNPSDFNFFRKTKRDAPDAVMYGMELEISTKLSPTDLQRVVAEVEPKQEPFFICKQDSSISGRYSNAIELVTVPASSRYLRNAWGLFFKKLERLIQAKGKRIEDYVDIADNLSNGLHIHVSKEGFKARHQTRFLSVWQSHDSQTKAFLQQLSGRPTDYYGNQYCPIDRAYQGVTIARKLRANLSSGGRSVCHAGNTATVEVRIFQGIFNLSHVLRCLETVEGIYNFTEMLGYSSFGMRLSSQLKEFFMKSAGYRHVKEMFKCA